MVDTQYVRITIIYCSEDFDEVLGKAEDGRWVAGFVVPNMFEIKYPSVSNVISIHKSCVFNVPSLDYNVLPYMRYGSIALLLKDLFPLHNYDLVCSRAIERLVYSIDPPPFLRYPQHKMPNIVCITPRHLVINDVIIDLSEGIPLPVLVSRETVKKAISMRKQTSCAINDLSINKIQKTTGLYFFTVHKL